MTDSERRRLHDAFRRFANSSGYISRQSFLREVLGDSIPASLAEQVYALCIAGNLGWFKTAKRKKMIGGQIFAPNTFNCTIQVLEATVEDLVH